MYCPKDFEKYEKQLSSLNLSHITSWAKFEEDLERGVEGEDKVFEILSKYTSKIKREVVLWGRKHDRVTEVDFIAEINGYCLICEVKEWYGKVALCSEKEKVNVSYVNTANKYVVRTRTSPVYSVAAFSSDLATYLKPNQPKKDIQLIRYVVFSRDDLELDDSLKEYNTSIKMFNLETFDKALEELSLKKNEQPYSIEKPMPSWDYYYNEREDKWYKCAIISEEIETNVGKIKTSEIDSLLLADDFNTNSLIKLTNGSVIEAIVDRRSIKVNSLKQIAMRYIYRFIKFDPVLHQ